VDNQAYEILIVGSGPAGLAAAVRAARRGVKHIVLERANFASTIHRYRKGKFVMAEPTSVSLHADMDLEFIADSRESVLERWQRDCQRAGVEIRVGPDYDVLGVDGQKGNFTVRTRGGQTFLARNVVLAIGTSGAPRPFGAPGEDLPHVVFEIQDAADYQDQQIVIVGAGDSAIEDALALAEQDNDVVLIQRRSGFDRAKPANRTAIENAMSAGEVKVHSHSTVRQFEPGAVWIDTPDEEVYQPSDLVIGRLGARPPRGFLESLGIHFDSDDPEALPSVSESYESNVPGLYLVGELVGRPLIKYCMNQGYEVVDLILGYEVQSAEEPLLREIIAPLRMDLGSFCAELCKRVPLFRDLSRRQIEGWLADSKIHTFRAGELIYQNGDFGETFFTILDGAVELLRDEELSGARRKKIRLGRRGAEDSESTPVVVNGGEFFGEDSLLSGRGRSETAVALVPTVVVETSRTAMLRVASSIKAVGDALDHAWAIRKLSTLLPMLDYSECMNLANSAHLAVHTPGATLFREGDVADGIYLIRRGSVVVSREREGEDRVVNYVSAGNTLGEVGLMRPSMQRTATVRAAVRTETLRIPAEIMLDLANRFPELGSEYRRNWHEQAVRDERVLATPGSTSLLDFVVGKGGKEATDLLFIDEAMCIRCDNCEKACAATHSGVSRLDREAGSRYAGVHLPTSCQHCENPDCMTDCPPEAIKRHPDGEVYIVDTCIGCGNCAAYCSYGVIKMTELADDRAPGLLASILFGAKKRRPRRASIGGGHGDGAPTHDVAVKCDLCRDLKTRSDGAPVACVSACPTGAITRIQPYSLLERLTVDVRPRSYTIEDRGSSFTVDRNGEQKPAPPPVVSADQLAAQAKALIEAAGTSSGSVDSSSELAAVLRDLAARLDQPPQDPSN